MDPWAQRARQGALVRRLRQGLPRRFGFGVRVGRRRQFMHEVRHDARDSLHVRGAVRPRKHRDARSLRDGMRGSPGHDW